MSTIREGGASADSLLHANGVSGLTGEYLLAPIDMAETARCAKEASGDAEVTNVVLRQLARDRTERSYGLPFNIDPADVRTAGWAIVFSAAEEDDVREALRPLIERRRKQIGNATAKVLDHQPGEEWREWLDRHETAPGNVDPNKVPYYILLVGAPSRIPFTFQYLLDVEYAVGRVDFDDAAGYRRYVEALADQEAARKAPRDKTAVFFATRHSFDTATNLSADRLVTPLAQSFRPGGRFGSDSIAHQVHCVVGEDATKAALGQLLAGNSPYKRPALLFSATHGIGGWPAGHAEQVARHGALLCQDWPGVGQISDGQYCSAADVAPDAQVHGMIAFLFACYGAGTPRSDQFRHSPDEPPSLIAERPFVARLPKALLSHPNGGALAVIGHVERVWGYSFSTGNDSQLMPFQNAIGCILQGQPVGYAMKDFNERYAALSVGLSDLVESINYAGKIVPDSELADRWMERNDAQNYVVLGDPAAALNTV